MDLTWDITHTLAFKVFSIDFNRVRYRGVFETFIELPGNTGSILSINALLICSREF